MKLRKVLAVVLLAAVIAPTAIIPVSAAEVENAPFPSVIDVDVNYEGDVSLGALDIAGKTVVINGDVRQSGDVRLSGGTLIVTGDYTVVSGTLYADTGSVTVQGNVLLDGGSLDCGEGIVNFEAGLEQNKGAINVNAGELNVGESIKQKANVTCSDGKVAVGGDWIQTSGVLSIDNANVLIDGGYTLADPEINADGELTGYTYVGAALTMTGEYGHMRISGDTVIKSSWNSSSNVLTNGLMELGGNFYQYIGNGSSDNFNCKDSHLVKLIGEDTQIINFESPKYSGFNILLPSNNPKAEITSGSIKRTEGTSVIGSFTQYGTMEFGGSSLTVTKDLTQYGTIKGGIFGDMGTLNVGGDLTQKGGFLYVNGADIHVNGSYYIADPQKDEQGAVTGYSYVGAALCMDNDEGTLTVDKDMVTSSSWSSTSNVLTAGTLVLGGNFTQLNGNGASDNFNATGTHKTTFSGTEKQIIDFQGRSGSGFNLLTNSFNKAADITSGAIAKLDSDCVVGSFNQYRELDLNGHTLVVNGDMVQHGNIKLNGGKLVVTGDYRQEGGFLYIQDGRLEISGDYRLQSLQPDGSYTYTGAAIDMTDANGYFLVGGDFVTQSSWTSTSNVLTAGVLELKGNFTQIPGNGISDNFDAKDAHRVIFSGSGLQTAVFESPKSSGFNTLAKTNNTEVDVTGRISYVGNGPQIRNFVQYGDLNLNGRTFTVSGNMTEKGNIKTGGGTLNVGGNYLHTDNTLKVQSGNVVVGGDYRIQSLSADGSYNYTGAALCMQNEKGRMTVGGNFVTQSSWTDSSNVLTAGTLELKGDFTQLRGNGYGNNFCCKDKHKVVFTGKGEQTVEFQSSDNSGFNILLASNNPKLNIKAGSFASLEGTSNIGSFAQYKELDLNGNTLTLNGDMTQWGNIKANAGTMNVKGNYLQSRNTLYIQNGRVNIAGDYRIQYLSADGTYTYAGAALNMSDPAGYLRVRGNMTTQSSWTDSSNVLTAGTLELKGNFTQIPGNGYSNNFLCKDQHKVLFTGTGKQTVNFESSDNSGFNILLASNNPKLNVEKGSFATLEGNSTIGSFTQYKDFDLAGNTLTVTGDMTQWGYIRANGGTLNVKGNYLQSRNTLYIQNGKVNIDGDYRIQALTPDGTYTYAGAALDMEDPAGYLTVKGNMTTQSSWTDSANVLTAGTLELKGDFTQLRGNGYSDNFKCKDQHKVIFTGTGKQTVNFESCDNSGFNILLSTNNPKLDIEAGSFAGLEGNSTIGSFTQYKDLYLTGGTLTVTGDMTQWGYIRTDGGTLNVKGNYLQSRNTLYVQNGRVNIDGDYRIQTLNSDGTYSYAGAALDMEDKDGYLFVGGQFFTQSSWTDSANILTAGTFELQGDLTQKTGNGTISNFVCKKNHKMILSGDKEQYIKISNNKKSRFAELYINKPVSKVHFVNPVIYSKMEVCLLNNSAISAEQVKVGQRVYIFYAAEGGTEPYGFACFYKRSTNSKWNGLTGDNPTFVPTAAADYDIKTVVVDSEGRITEKIFKLKVVPANTLENTSSVNSDKVTVGQTVTVTGSAEGGQSPYTFEYYFKRSTNIKWNTLNPSKPVFTPTAAADYEIKVVARDAQGNEAVKIMDVKVAAALTNTSSVSSESVTAGTTVKVTGSAEGGFAPYTFEYYFKRSTNSKWNTLKTSNPSFTPTAAADYDVKVVATDSTGAKSTKVLQVKVS